jgi:hypothetical protein
MDSLKVLSKALAFLVSTCFLAIPNTIIAAPPEQIPPVLQDVSDRIDALEAFIRRLHGNKAAAASRSIDLGTDGRVNSVQFILTYCIGPGLGGPGSGDICRLSSADYSLTTGGFFDEDSDGQVITFNADNSPDFADVVNLLTNGTNDRMGLVLGLAKPSDVLYSTAQSGPERFYFFIQPQTSSGIGYVDLEGFEIDEISISIDSISPVVA